MTTIKSMRWLGVVTCAVVLAVGSSSVLAEAHATKKTTASAKSSTLKKSSGRAALPNRAVDPCLGAIVVDAATGQVLAEENADAVGYPASVIKLMDMMVLLDQVSAGKISLSNAVTVTAEAAKIGGSQVYLKEGEVFTLEDLMYALMIQSANDSAMAMALSVAGSSAGFVEMMNKKAAELGMTNTKFNSVHGLPPVAGQGPDTSTARDLAKLACALIAQHPEILKFTSTQVRNFRPNATPGPFVMRTHNHLLQKFPGCDGLKTGYFTAAGYSIVATAQKGGRRVITVVLGSKGNLGKVRDAKAMELLSKGFAALPPLPPPPVIQTVTTNLPAALPVTEEPVPETPHMGWLKIAGIGLAIGLVALGIGSFFLKKRSRNDF